MGWTPFDFFEYDPDKIDFTKTTFNVKRALNNNWAHIKNLIEEIRKKADEKADVNAAVTLKQNVSIATSAWTSDTTYADYPFKANIPITGCTVNHIPDVMLSLEDATSGNFAPVADSYAGVICIYAKEKPTSAMTIPTIKLTRTVN